MATFHFDIVTPTKRISSGEVHMVVVPGTEGDFGVLAGHAPVLSVVRQGVIEVYRTPGSEPERIEVDGGLAEVNAAGLTILTGELQLHG
ncbi:MAG: ATP synthase F1 subunit epsilon [Sphingomonadaceae bacterium]